MVNVRNRARHARRVRPRRFEVRDQLGPCAADERKRRRRLLRRGSFQGHCVPITQLHSEPEFRVSPVLVDAVSRAVRLVNAPRSANRAPRELVVISAAPTRARHYYDSSSHPLENLGHGGDLEHGTDELLNISPIPKNCFVQPPLKSSAVFPRLPLEGLRGVPGADPRLRHIYV